MSLEEKLRQPGFSPRKQEAAGLLVLLSSADPSLARAAERALARLGPWAGEQVLARLAAAVPPLRGRLCRVLGRVVVASGQPALISALLELVDDADPRTRRNAITALGKLGGSPTGRARAPLGLIEERLLARWSSASELVEQRSLVAALGKVGGGAALEALKQAGSVDSELSRLLEEALLKIERTLGRASPGRIDPRRPAPAPLRVCFHCRAGLEAILAEELGAELSPRPRPPGRVEARWAGSLERLQRPRTALRFGFPLPPRPLDEGEDLAAAIAGALAAPAARVLLSTFTEGPIRFRLEWSGAGHRRGLSFRVAAEAARRWPALRNDPTASLWEVSIRTGREGRRLQLELWPRGLPDPRFGYRRRDLPAASHPTLAAALARVAGVRPDDVCWDPFVGSGTELVERGLLGPYARLLGSDSDPTALEAAAENLAAAGLERFQLELGDAAEHEPPARPSLIITNPPLGRRLLRAEGPGPLLERFLERAAGILLPGGRLVWISPLPEGGLPLLRAVGLELELRQRVDMGGFHAELQRLRRTAGQSCPQR